MSEGAWSPTLERKMTWFFRTYDVNGSGDLTREDFNLYLVNLQRKHGLDLSNPRYRKLVEIQQTFWDTVTSSADANQDQKVTFEEWMAFTRRFVPEMRRQARETGTRPYEEWGRTLFQLLDANGDGLIQPGEYVGYMSCLNTEGADVEGSWRRLDPDGRGVLTEQQFFDRLVEYWESDDPEASGNYFLAVPQGYFEG